MPSRIKSPVRPNGRRTQPCPLTHPTHCPIHMPSPSCPPTHAKTACAYHHARAITRVQIGGRRIHRPGLRRWGRKEVCSRPRQSRAAVHTLEAEQRRQRPPDDGCLPLRRAGSQRVLHCVCLDQVSAGEAFADFPPTSVLVEGQGFPACLGRGRGRGHDVRQWDPPPGPWQMWAHAG